MHRLFGLLAHPTEDVVLGRAPRIYRSLEQRLDAARAAHDERKRDVWLARAVELAETRAPAGQVEAEQRAHQARATEEWAEREAVIRRGGERHAVAGFDLCFSPPKSVSVLWAAADQEGREKIWRAHREGVTAALGYLEREAAWSRAGYNGIRQVDTTGWVVASFEHRMSRAGDVQIHTHNAVLNRVRCADGEWRSLDGRAIYRAAASAGALYDRVREAALERDLGVRHEQRKPDGPREIVGVDDDICRLFSARRTQIEGRLAELVAAWRARAGGAEPSQWTISPAEPVGHPGDPAAQGSTREAPPRRWPAGRPKPAANCAVPWPRCGSGAVRRTQSITGPMTTVRGRSNQRQRSPTDDEVLAAAVGVVDAREVDLDPLRPGPPAHPHAARWTLRSTRQGQLARIDELVDMALGERAADLGVIDLSARAVFDTPAELRRRGDGGSVYEEHGATRYSTNAALAAELAVLDTAGDRSGPRLNPTPVDAVIDTGQPGWRPSRAACAKWPPPGGESRRWSARPGPARPPPCGPWPRAWRAGGGAGDRPGRVRNRHPRPGRPSRSPGRQHRQTALRTHHRSSETESDPMVASRLRHRPGVAGHSRRSRHGLAPNDRRAAPTVRPHRLQAAARRRPRTTRQPRRRRPVPPHRRQRRRRPTGRGAPPHRRLGTSRQPPPARRRHHRPRRLRPAGRASTAATRPTWKTPPSKPPWPTGPAGCARSCSPTPTSTPPAWPAAPATNSSPPAPSTTPAPWNWPTGTGPGSATASSPATTTAPTAATAASSSPTATSGRSPPSAPDGACAWPESTLTPTNPPPATTAVLDADYVGRAGAAGLRRHRARRPRRHPRHLPCHHQLPHQPPRTVRGAHPGTRGEPGLRRLLPTRRRRPRRPHPRPPRRACRHPGPTTTAPTSAPLWPSKPTRPNGPAA